MSTFRTSEKSCQSPRTKISSARQSVTAYCKLRPGPWLGRRVASTGWGERCPSVDILGCPVIEDYLPCIQVPIYFREP